jgi:acetyl esterase/lipase
MKAKEVVALWPTGQVPYALGTGPEDTPTLTLYRPKRPTGSFTVVCPGGGYGGLAGHEGEPIAQWLNTAGITAGVLTYRHAPKYQHPCPLTDAQRAIRTARANASAWKLDKNRVGILGFSAGGHLTSTAATHFDRGILDAPDAIDKESCRPDVAAPIYPVITLEPPFAHMGSRRNLLGDNPTTEQVRLFSNHLQVTKDTPPCFLMHTTEDTVVPVENSLLFATALSAHKVPYALHVYEKGQHGIGLGNDSQNKTWPAQCIAWLQSHGF